MNDAPTIDELFERRVVFPEGIAKQRLARLTGIDDQKARLKKILGALVNPSGIEAWSKKHQPKAVNAVATVLRRPPLIILAGDVGSGKTELSETIGDMIAREEEIDVTLYPLSLASRGKGMVGQMTTLLTAAFDFVIDAGSKLKSAHGKSRGGIIMLVDEADALAQSREATQMHHEDRAGVNTFIRGIDRIANLKLPAAVLMCTNRPNALDPAVKRRAADILIFSRPDASQRKAVLEGMLDGLNFSAAQLEALVTATGPRAKDVDGFTYSDLMQRLIPAIVLDAYPDGPVRGPRAIEIALAMEPTPRFREQT